MTPPIYELASFFAGIGGFDLGAHLTGRFRTTTAVEIVAHRRNTLARHFPGIDLQEDIRETHPRHITGSPDVFAAGFPCKQLSIAAPHRKGLDGKDSGLLYDFYRLLGAYLAHVAYARPRIVVLENTPGLLRSRKGRDMAAVVMGLEELGYGWAYRVVNGRDLGTPDVERERVVIVGHLGGDPRPALTVLGLTGAGSETAPASPGRRRGPGPHARSLAVGGEVVRLWRKGANSPVSIEKGYEGGYRETWVPDGRTNTFVSADAGNALRQKHLLFQSGRLRTFTPVEWERAAMFPDNWTEGMPHNARMQALGDTFHVGTSQWLFHGVAGVLDALAAHPRIFDAPHQEQVEYAEASGQLALFA